MNTECACTWNASKVSLIHGGFGNAPRQDDASRSGPDDRVHVFLQSFGVQGFDAVVAKNSRLERNECAAFTGLNLLGFLPPPFDPSQRRLSIIKAGGFVRSQSFAVDSSTGCFSGFRNGTNTPNGPL